jgi:polyphosphate kinase
VNTPLFFNRELSFLEFNERVLDMARDAQVPLLERLKFLAISCSNLDEFFEIRVAGLRERQSQGGAPVDSDGRSVAEQLQALELRAHEQIAAQYQILNAQLTPELRHEGIDIVTSDQLTDAEHSRLQAYFASNIEPVLSPLGLDPARPFPRIQNKSLNFIVRLEGTDAFGRDSHLAILQVPRSLPRIVPFPGDTHTPSKIRLISLSAIISACIGQLFDGVSVTGCWQFRVTRNSDLFVDEEEIDDLRRAIEGELMERRYGDSVRLETGHDLPAELAQFLLKQFELSPRDHYAVPGLVNLNRLIAAYDLIDRPELKYPAFTPTIPDSISHAHDLFTAIRERDILLHHPYESFAPVVDLVRQAARDKHVLAIKQTLYRSGSDSAIVDALVDAAQQGKDVTVIVELMARFDEAANIELANRLQEAGAHVMFGVVGYKTHAKLLMVVRQEADGIRRYCHIGTGNYHAKTARIYTDYGLFTCQKAIGEDVHALFLQLTGVTRIPRLKKLLQSPFTLHSSLISHIEREIAHAQQGKKARVIAKMNSLVEPSIIQKLYEASNAGVQIDLIVRGMCTLVPGVVGQSANIRVRSIVGRFLEHSRVFYFYNDDKEELWCASADWMDRNLFRRVEVAFPLERRLRNRIIEDLHIWLEDNTNAWELQSTGQYQRVLSQQEPARTAHARFLQALTHSDSAPPKTLQAMTKRKPTAFKK